MPAFIYHLLLLGLYKTHILINCVRDKANNRCPEFVLKQSFQNNSLKIIDIRFNKSDNNLKKVNISDKRSRTTLISPWTRVWFGWFVSIKSPYLPIRVYNSDTGKVHK